MPSKFLEWFEEQYGPRPSCPSVDEQVQINRAYNIAKEQVRNRAAYDKAHEAALYAWQAREKVLE